MTVEAIKNIDTNQDGLLSRQEFDNTISVLSENKTREAFKTEFTDAFANNSELQKSLLNNIDVAFTQESLTDEDYSNLALAHMLVFGRPYAGLELSRLTPLKLLNIVIEDSSVNSDMKQYYLEYMTDIISGKTSLNLTNFDYNKDSRLSLQEIKEIRGTVVSDLSRITELGSYEEFSRVASEIEEDINSVSFVDNLKELTGGDRLSGELVEFLSNLGEEESKQLLSAKWGDENFGVAIIYALSREIPGAIEDALVFLADLPIALTQLHKYAYYKYRDGAEYDMKAGAMEENHPVFALFGMIGNIDEIAPVLIDKLGSPSTWTAESIAVAITMIFALISGGATVAGKGGAIASKFGGTMGKVGTKLEAVAQDVGRVARNMDNMMNPQLAYAHAHTGEMGNMANRADDLSDNNMYSVADTWNAGKERFKGMFGGERKDVPKGKINENFPVEIEEMKGSFMLRDNPMPRDAINQMDKFYQKVDLGIVSENLRLLDDFEEILNGQFEYLSKLNLSEFPSSQVVVLGETISLEMVPMLNKMTKPHFPDDIRKIGLDFLENEEMIKMRKNYFNATQKARKTIAEEAKNK